jgi:hypothetical protein
VLGPFNNTELFFGAGEGMRSNDARGATIAEEPTDPGVKLSASPLLVRTKGAETGVQTKVIPGLDSSLSIFMLDQDSELATATPATPRRAGRAGATVWSGPTATAPNPGSISMPIWR